MPTITAAAYIFCTAIPVKNGRTYQESRTSRWWWYRGGGDCVYITAVYISSISEINKICVSKTKKARHSM